MKQVDASHYRFDRYMDRGRWASLWHQLDEVLRLQPRNVLEIGPGAGVFKAVSGALGLHVRTLDPDPELQPDIVGSALSIPLQNGAVDLCCAFQVLEHLPYADALAAFAEMRRVARRHVVISLPDVRPLWYYRVHLPRVGTREWLLPRPFFRPVEHVFNGEHHWEINKQGYEIARIRGDFGRVAKLVRSFRVPEHSYHHFLVFDAAAPAGQQ